MENWEEAKDRKGEQLVCTTGRDETRETCFTIEQRGMGSVVRKTAVNMCAQCIATSAHMQATINLGAPMKDNVCTCYIRCVQEMYLRANTPVVMVAMSMRA